ncbi:tubulin-tyrosine ligase family protein, putative [Ichthyophthirius multifiliis]|uniref:Tubulin-tyrosine ligase family protein, putative n=1 Tax=Ichthyophthirius multifiliis TaxID=5932 RepID=G0R0N0_ICHMU|nr:tubulin-tyrosine ligase family protein, putative [Ichthyophthirius multifiliis]EGR28974.1 tubulin-tyrosine ligase family protein, putative [Ichthyophthirius multifiliis]|eukprot:XP_004030210.1 tubulin-tyrosine ligase family protein, putative [Ichthyophthirius multifiliis]
MSCQDEEYKDLEKENEDQKKDQKFTKEQKITTQDLIEWKKSKGYSPNQKVFMIVGSPYQDLRESLINLGWIENKNIEEDQMFDLKWISQKDIDFNLFYPKCFEITDVQEFEDFVEEFKFCKAESILKQFIQFNIEDEFKKTDFFAFLQIQVYISCLALKKKCLNVSNKIQEILKNNFPFINPNEWLFINNNYKNLEFFQKNKDLYNEIHKNTVSQFEKEELNLQLVQLAKKYLQILEKYDPQYNLNQKNLWIVKPAGLSRGRGIRTFDQLQNLVNYVMGRDVTWVAQKYIENPLTINKKKFDIRQWACVTDWNPLVIYFYEECYIRICFDEFNIDDLQNKFAHLANNCISKNAANFEEKINETMMFQNEFVDYINVSYFLNINFYFILSNQKMNKIFSFQKFNKK